MVVIYSGSKVFGLFCKLSKTILFQSFAYFQIKFKKEYTQNFTQRRFILLRRYIETNTINNEND